MEERAAHLASLSELYALLAYRDEEGRGRAVNHDAALIRPPTPE